MVAIKIADNITIVRVDKTGKLLGNKKIPIINIGIKFETLNFDFSKKQLILSCVKKMKDPIVNSHARLGIKK